MTTITITHKTSFFELLTVFFIIPVLATAKAVKTAYTAFMAAKSWLNSVHDYSNEEGTIHMTGWQFVGFGLLVCTVAIVLSIQF